MYQPIDHFRGRLHSALPGVLVFLLVCVIALQDGFSLFEHQMMDVRFGSAQRQATGKLIIVEIDAKSVKDLKTWPWPRSRHAELIDKLTAAGAARIAFDVDFSSPSIAAQDLQLALAIEASGGRVILPAFGQRETTSHENTRTVSSEPLQMFRDYALVGHVNIWPLGSLARTVRAGAFFGETYRPAMAALISDQMVQSLDERYIDFSIDPYSIPRISFSAVISGDFDPNFFRDRTVIVGGTAIELGDRLPVPVYGVLPGVTVQALAAESMSMNRSIVRTGAPVTIAMTLVLLCLFQTRWLRGWMRASAGTAVIIVVTAFGAQIIQDHWAISTDLGPQFAILVFAVVRAAASDLIERAMHLRTERARSAARQALIALIVEDSSDGIVAVDAVGKIVICNVQAATMFDRSPEQMQGQRIEAFLPLSAEPFVNSASSRERFPFTFEKTIARDGVDDPTIAEIVVNRVVLNAEAAEPVFVVTMRDVTARKRVETAERNASEERLLAERAKSLFIANMSHELRTPLNAIIGFTEILTAESLGPLGHAKYREYSDVVLKSGKHLLEMINNVLEISRLESGGIRAESRLTSLAPLIDSSFAFIRNGRDFVGQTLRVEGLEVMSEIQTDPRLFKQILINLLANAVKFTKPGQKNSATVRVSKGNSGSLHLTVEDDGAGMTPDLLARVTDLFFQGDGTFTRKHEGRGLGLYLVKKHVEILGGTLTFESTPDVGTKVHIDLPNAIPSVTRAEAAA